MPKVRKDIYDALKRTAARRLSPDDPTTTFVYSEEPPHGTILCVATTTSPTKPFAQSIANVLAQEKAVKFLFSSCTRVADNEIKIIVNAP